MSFPGISEESDLFCKQIYFQNILSDIFCDIPLKLNNRIAKV